MPAGRPPRPPPAAASTGPGRRTWFFGAAVAACVAILVYAVFFWPSEEEKVREAVDAFAHAIRVEESANPAFRALRLRGDLGEVLSPDARAIVPDLQSSITGRREIVSLAASAGGAWSLATISLADVRVEIDSSKSNATVRATALLRAVEHGGAPRRDERHVTFELHKEEGRWWIDTIEVPPPAGGRD